MASKAKPNETLDNEVEPVFGAVKTDLLDLAKRGKNARVRRNYVRQKLAKLLDLDPKAEAKARLKEHEACIKAARKRVQQMRTAYLKRTKKAPPLIKQIQTMISREET
jgi:hypothetical protein